MSLNILIIEGNNSDDSSVFVKAAGATAADNLKNLVGFYAREDKPTYWAMYEREEKEHDEGKFCYQEETKSRDDYEVPRTRGRRRPFPFIL